MKYKIILSAELKKHKGGLLGISLLTFLMAAALETVVIIWGNTNVYIREETERAGFGELTIWVSGVPEDINLVESMEALPDIRRVETQSLIFSNYTVKGKESDSEGQLITYRPEEHRYRFLEDDLSGYKQQPEEIGKGEVYVSPSMISMFDVQPGDEITFSAARSGRTITLLVKGFFEDPFMGSSMIGMKGFLVSEADRKTVLSILENAGIDALARNGAMLHIFPSTESKRTVSELNGIINEQTAVSEYSEEVYGKETIVGFMVILQNAFCALLLAFVMVLLFTVLIVISHGISSTVETDMANMGILKTIGFTSAELRLIRFLQYLVPILAGMLSGILFSVPVSRKISNAAITTTGIRIPTKLPPVLAFLSIVSVILLLMGFVMIRTSEIGRIKPMQIIRRSSERVRFHSGKMVSAFGNGLHFRLAFRQLMTGRRRYVGAMTVSVLLVFFASIIGRMDAWLGPDGRGMMEAFNPADHDIGVQSFGRLTWEECEDVIRSYTDITDDYVLAMPTVAVNGVDHTVNVIDQPGRFHILEGRTCMRDNEIVLTEFAAADFGLSIGDTVRVGGDSGISEYVVSGIYSCANDMGRNIGMSREGYLKIGRDHPNLWCHHYFLEDSSRKGEIAKALETEYGGDVHVHENTWPGLSGIISAMQALVTLMYGMVIVFILLVTVMTGSKILLAEQKDLGIYKAIGFRVNRLRITFAIRFGMISAAGAVIGVLLEALLTDRMVSEVMKLAGISNFASAPSVGKILFPAVAVVVLFTGFAYLAAGKMKKNILCF